MKLPRVLDNKKNKVVDALKEELHNGFFEKRLGNKDVVFVNPILD